MKSLPSPSTLTTASDTGGAESHLLRQSKAPGKFREPFPFGGPWVHHNFFSSPKDDHGSYGVAPRLFRDANHTRSGVGNPHSQLEMVRSETGHNRTTYNSCGGLSPAPAHIASLSESHISTSLFPGVYSECLVASLHRIP